MRITIITSRLDIGGTERHLARVVPALCRRGWNITLYVMERGGSLEDEVSRQSVRVEGPARARLLHWPRATLELARFLRQERPDLVHFFLPRPYIFGSIAAELVGQRWRLMSRRSLANYMGRYPFVRFLERMLHRRCAALIGNSKAVTDQLSAECGNPRKVALLHNGIDIPAPITPAERHLVRHRLGISDETLVIAVVANLIPYKGHRDFIEALAIVKNKMPGRWSVLMIGRDEGIGEELKASARARGLAENVLWLGERADAGELLRASDVFVLPSHEEGFSNALLEAMASGIASIATAVGGNFDAVVNDETGLLVNAKDAPALGAAILRLAGDKSLRDRLGAAARRRVGELYSFDDCVSRYEALYRAIGENEKPLNQILAAVCVKPSAHAMPPA